MSSDLERYLNKQWNRLVGEVSALRERITSDAVHDLRIAYKKVRAVSRNSDARGILEPLRPLYTACGAVREPEVLEGILSVIDRDTELKTVPLHRSLQGRRRSAHRRVHQALASLSDEAVTEIAYELERGFSKRSPEQTRRAIRDHLQARRRRLCSRIPHLVETETLHAVRKDLKDISYLQRFAYNSKRKRRPEFEDRIADAESFLGVVHDQQQLYAYIRTYPLDRLDRTTWKFLMGRLQRSIGDAVVEITPRLQAICQEE